MVSISTVKRFTACWSKITVLRISSSFARKVSQSAKCYQSNIEDEIPNLILYTPTNEVVYPDIAMKDELDPDNDSSSLDSDYSSENVTSLKGNHGFASFCRDLGNLNGSELRREVDKMQFSMVEKLGMLTISWLSCLHSSLIYQQHLSQLKTHSGMISIDDKFSQGSVENARGRKMSILPAEMANKRHSRMKNLVENTNRRCTNIQRRGSKFRG